MPTFTLTTDDGQQHEFSPTVLRLNDGDKLLIELQNDTSTEIMDIIVEMAAKWAGIDSSRVMVVDPGAKISVLKQESPKYKYVTEEEWNKLIEKLQLPFRASHG